MPPARRTTGATIGDVASRAGVSRATVSRVMNGLATVDPQIAARVRSAADELDYRPSAAARSLALGRTHTVGYLVPDLTNPAFHGAMRGLSLAAADEGYRVLVADSAERAADEAPLAIETRRRCDALVLCAPRMPQQELVELLPQLQPVILLNRNAEEAGLPLLNVDWASGMRDLLRHLTGLGHRRIAYLAGPPASASNTDRLSGLRNLPAGVELLELECGAMFTDGHEAAGRVLDAEVSAVMAFNDVVAVGLLGALHEFGTDVPGEISVTGFDDIPYARFTAPPLTTAAVPQEEMGRLAWQRLRAILAGGHPHDRVLIRPRLVTRASTARARSTPSGTTRSRS
ncbi:LacI family DNA-binding transcriptional regulator [Microlunatus ginsengisoli]|uniref:HTH lacI-type domain-containing protein n=1 Tax=Microlunatus ginsengisoli TaxID=363863 RepID=A0ABP6ZNQ4_9ACTN